MLHLLKQSTHIRGSILGTTIDDKISELVIHIAVPYETETKASALYVAQIPIAIPTNYYNTPSRLINALNLAIDQKTAQEYQNYSKFVKDLYGKPSRNTFSSLARFSFDTLINRACIAITTGENIVEKLRLSPRLSYVLGFGRNKYTILDKDWVLDNGNNQNQMGRLSTGHASWSICFVCLL